jgi:hypothetical protein
MLIAEDLALLLLDDDSGKALTDRTRLDSALAGAVLLELALHGRVEPDAADRKQRLRVSDPRPTGDVVLDDALRRVADKQPVKAESILGAVAKGLRDDIFERLVARGILRRQDGKVLGLFPTTQWPAQDSAHERQLRQRLSDVLVVGLTPDPHTRALVSLLLAVDALPKVVGTDRADKRELKRRAKELADGEWAGAAVRKAVEAVNTAVAVSIGAAVAASAASSGS